MVMEKVSTRQTNIELLRLIAACGVIVLHYNSNTDGAFYIAPDNSINQFILVFLESLSICAVNVFVLISGYFLSRSNIRDFFKPAGLLMQVAVFAILAFFIEKILIPGSVTIDTLFEFLFSSNWYIYVFIALYMISPFINVMWKALNTAGKRILLAFSFFFFSVYPTFIDVLIYWSGRQLNGSSTIGLEGSQAGYTIVNFILLYIIGAFIRDSSDSKLPSNGNLFPRYFICLCLDMAWAFLDGIRQGKKIYDTIAWNYSNPFIIAEAAIIVMIFLNLNIKQNKVINKLASASLTVYILHLRFLGFFQIEKFAKGNPLIMIVHMIITVIVIYFICFLCHLIYKYPARLISNLASKKFGGFRKISI